MKSQPEFRLSSWMACSLCGLVVANLLLILFVAGVDIFFRQPPQFMVPLFALLIASGSLAFSRQRNARAETNATAAAMASQGFRQSESNAPAYVAMTIIRRPLALVSSAGDDNWKGEVQ